MSPGLKQCEAKALKLSAPERAMLAHRLITSLDTLKESENEGLWVEEADRRYKAYQKGRITAKPARDVLRDARATIR
jgi:putative addiction module component (TIGR02574 family)